MTDGRSRSASANIFSAIALLFRPTPKHLPAFAKALAGKPAGERVASAGAAAEGFGSAGPVCPLQLLAFAGDGL